MEVLEQARRQTVTGLVYLALEKKEFHLPEDVITKLMISVSSLVNRNIKLQAVETSVLEMFGHLHPVVMKGSVCAARYPSPQMRESGDIDLYFSPEDYPAAVNLLCGDYSVNSDEGVCFFRDGCTVELHNRYYDLHTPNVPDISTPEGELLMLAAHIFKHASGPGVGLRQICDFALAWHAYKGNMDDVFRAAGLEQWARLLLSFTHDYIDPSVKVRHINPKPLLRLVEKSGNFGHYSSSRERRLQKSSFIRKTDTALRIISHIPFALRYAPGEVFPRIKELVKGNI